MVTVGFSLNFAVVFSSYRQTIRRLSSHRDGDGDVKGEGDGDGEVDEGRREYLKKKWSYRDEQCKIE